MDPKLVLQAAAAARMGLGVILLAAPQLASRVIGAETGTATANLITRVAGVRDVVVGAGTLRATLTDDDPAAWGVGSAICDFSDSIAHVIALRDLPRIRNIGTIVGAAGFGAAQLKAAIDLKKATD